MTSTSSPQWHLVDYDNHHSTAAYVTDRMRCEFTSRTDEKPALRLTTTCIDHPESTPHVIDFNYADMYDLESWLFSCIQMIGHVRDTQR